MSWDTVEVAPGDPDGLRYYQRACFDAVRGDLEKYKRVLAFMATGLGKTQIFSALAKHFDGNVLVLAHRAELVEQARKRLEEMTGEWVEVEEGQFRSHQARIVVGSVDSVKQRNRLERLGPDRFQLIVTDEAHHYVKNTFTRPLEYWHQAKVFGVTATERGDGKAMGGTFDHVSYTMDILAGIDAGYLVPFDGKRERVTAIDLREVKKSAGDLARGALESVMVKAVEGVVKVTLEKYGDRRGPLFFPGVKSAEFAANRLNTLRPGCAVLVTGKTEASLRKELIRDCKSGRVQYLCNCEVATEGFDWPEASLVGIARPTLSRPLYTQMAGRGGRTLPGTVDYFEGPELASVRRNAIAASDKPDCVLVDFVGNSGKHHLMGPEDILAGKYSKEEVKRARKIAEKEEGGDPYAHLEQARRELEEMARAIESRVASETETFNPFGVFNNRKMDEFSVKLGFKEASMKQKDALVRIGMERSEVKELSSQQAQKLLSTAAMRRKFRMADYRQLKVLQRHGIVDRKITQARARQALLYIHNAKKVDPVKLRAIVERPRDPGEEG